MSKKNSRLSLPYPAVGHYRVEILNPKTKLCFEHAFKGDTEVILCPKCGQGQYATINLSAQEKLDVHLRFDCGNPTSKEPELEIYEQIEQETRFIWIPKQKMLLRYDPDCGVWREDGEAFIRKRVENLTERRASDRFKLEQVHHIKDRNYITYEELESRRPRNKICCLSGVVDLETGEIEPFNPDYYFFNQSPRKLVHGKPKFYFSVLASIMPDPRQRQRVEDYMISTLWQTTNIPQKLFLAGPGNNGKDILEDIVELIIGVENCANVPPQLLEQEANRFASAQLTHKLANICMDIGPITFKQTSMLKRLSGGSRIWVEDKGRKGFNFEFHGREIYAGNRFPDTEDRSPGWWRRWIPERLEQKFVDSPDPSNPTEHQKIEQDELGKRLASEADKIFTRWVRRLKVIVKHGNLFDTPSPKEVEEIWLNEISLIPEFMKLMCKLSADAKTPSKALYEAYSKFCSDRKRRPVSDQKFPGQLISSYPSLRHTTARILGKPTKVMVGIELNVTAETTGLRTLDFCKDSTSTGVEREVRQTAVTAVTPYAPWVDNQEMLIASLYSNSKAEQNHIPGVSKSAGFTPATRTKVISHISGNCQNGFHPECGGAKCQCSCHKESFAGVKN